MAETGAKRCVTHPRLGWPGTAVGSVIRYTVPWDHPFSRQLRPDLIRAAGGKGWRVRFVDFAGQPVELEFPSKAVAARERALLMIGPHFVDASRPEEVEAADARWRHVRSPA